MNKYIEQFYSEGLATTFYLKPLKLIEKKIKNKTIIVILKVLLKVIYTITAILFAILMFKIKFR